MVCCLFNTVFFCSTGPDAIQSEIQFTAERVYSILTDFGTEKEVWFTPGEPSDSQCDANLLFKFNMPLPDTDHSLHHASYLQFQSCVILLHVVALVDWNM